MKKIILYFLLFFPPFSLNLAAQYMVNNQDRCVWTEDGMVFLKETDSNKDRIVVYGKNDEIKMKISGPSPTSSSYQGIPSFVDGRFFWTRYKFLHDDHGKFVLDEIFEYLEGKWEQIGTYRHSKGIISFFPLRNDLFLGVSVHPMAIVDSGRSYPFGVFRLIGNKLSLVNGYDIGLKKPFFNSFSGINYEILSMALMDIQVAQTSSKIIIASPFGHFWSFNLDNGSFCGIVSLFESICDEKLENNELYPGLLGIQPTQLGDLLVCSRTEDVILNASKIVPNPKEGTLAAMHKYAKSIFHFDKSIRWYGIDINNRKVNEIAPPLNVQNKIGAFDDLMNFNWRFKYNGDLVVYDMKTRHGGIEKS